MKTKKIVIKEINMNFITQIKIKIKVMISIFGRLSKSIIKNKNKKKKNKNNFLNIKNKKKDKNIWINNMPNNGPEKMSMMILSKENIMHNKMLKKKIGLIPLNFTIHINKMIMTKILISILILIQIMIIDFLF